MIVKQIKYVKIMLFHLKTKQSYRVVCSFKQNNILTEECNNNIVINNI